jgi:class 3 adenylate cyclase
MPASPWLQTLDDRLAVQLIQGAALTMAATTAAPPGVAVQLRSTTAHLFRPATTDSEMLVARARALNVSRTFSVNEVLVEDASGRLLSHATGASVFRWTSPDQVSAAPLVTEQPIEVPSYPTPDPYLRPFPPEVRTMPAEMWEQYDGPTIARMYAAGELPQAPIMALFRTRVLEWDDGRVQFVLPATEWLAGEDRAVAPSVLAMLANFGLGGPTALKAERRRLQVGIVDDTVSFYRSVPCDGQELMGRGWVTHRPGDFIVTSTEITESDGTLVAVGHRTSVFLEPRPAPGPRSQRSLLTILFTDLVDSTRKAEHSGDEQWSQLLARHHELARRQFEIHHGREVKTTGDGFLATFDVPTRAVQCARAIRDGVRRLGLELRAGIHTGECEVGGGDVAGLAVHVASRVQSEAAPGEILVTSVVRDLMAGSGLRLLDRGEHALKGLDGTWALFAVEG